MPKDTVEKALPDEEVGRSDQAANAMHNSMLRTYDRKGKHRRGHDDGSADVVKKKKKTGTTLPEKDDAHKSPMEFTVDATGTETGLRGIGRCKSSIPPPECRNPDCHR
jgi:hypothetical protein